nr:nitrate reductase molybdenum cofactor assembly chaperone [Sulfobacillus harzensis]
MKLLSGLLDYPGADSFWARLADRIEVAEELESEVGQIMRRFQHHDQVALEKLYVETFDFDPKAALYVTAHELGDSRDRGEALIELTNLYHEAGYEVPDDQLADYLPLLLELLAVRPGLVPEVVVERVAKVAYNIAQHLDAAHLYRPLFVILNRVLGAPTEGLPTAEECPDLADLPYPIEYQ